MDILLKTLLDAARRVDIIQIGIDQYLEHLAWMKTTVTSSAITTQQRIYIKRVNAVFNMRTG